ncbi:MAG: amino acid racemase [Eubacteriales bacterium]|nr:amino acid racemase [Eubacteriales bacterium]
MKKLGLIGGVGPESTIPYYKGILYGVKARKETPYLPPLTIESLSCYEVIRMSNEGDTEGLTAYLLAGVRNLAAAGAEVGALACNTGHMVFDVLQKASPIPLVSIVDVTCAEAVREGYQKVGLLGTAVTMETDFFKKPFREVGIEVVSPDAEECAYIEDHIVNELEVGIVNEDTAVHILKVVERMVSEQKIEAIVLGCTELPLLFEGRKVPVPLLDTMKIHIDALINTILEE